MGVTRKFDELRPIRIEDEDQFNYNDFDLSESGDEGERAGRRAVAATDAENTSRSRRNKEKRADRRMRRVLNIDDCTDGMRMGNHMGSRKQRRIENARMLLSFTNEDDIVVDFSDLVPQSVTAFQKLFVERESMAAWNAFIEKDETQQREILRNGRWTTEEQSGWFVVGGKSTPRKTERHADGRMHHPAYSAKACYERLDRRSKKLLCKKQLPWAFVSKLEDDLRVFFSHTAASPRGGAGDSAASDDVFIGRYDSPICRALAHAVSQFLMLTATNELDPSGEEKVMAVRNGRAFFIPPHSTLIDHLSRLRNRPIEFVPWVDEAEEEISSTSSSVDDSSTTEDAASLTPPVLDEGSGDAGVVIDENDGDESDSGESAHSSFSLLDADEIACSI